MSNATTPPQPWRKVLYEQPAGLQDNYTDATFLEALVVNATVPRRQYWSVVQGSVAVVQQINIVAAIATAALQLHEVPTAQSIHHHYHHHHQGLLAPTTLLALNILVLAALGVACLLTGEPLPGGSLRRALRQVTLLTAGVYLLAPTYGTLSKTISTDTIVAVSTLLLLLHLLLHDYHFVNDEAARLRGVASMGAAVFAAVLLASRLQTDMRVFSHLTHSLTLFLLSPFLLRYVRRLSFGLHVLVTLGVGALTTAMMARVSAVATAVHLAACAFVCFGAPAWLVRIQKFKAQINGPWDEAVPNRLRPTE